MSRAVEWYSEHVLHQVLKKHPEAATIDWDRIAMVAIESSPDWRGPRAFEAKR